MKIDYNEQLNALIADLKGTKTDLLLHSCCGPCSSAVIERLHNYFNITVYYYNPNIEPEMEYLKRKACQLKLLEELNIPYLEVPYDHDTYLNVIKDQPLIKEGAKRCALCIKLRLWQTAQKAAQQDIVYFGTTLSVSPHKDATMINQTGLAIAQEFNIKFLVADFKKQNGYQRSIVLAKQYNLYRQDYCGCQASKKQP